MKLLVYFHLDNMNILSRNNEMAIDYKLFL